MTEKSELGKLGENLAYEHLVKKGYKILERNFRRPWGELDIIARAPDKTLVFVEVKSMTASASGLQPEDQMSQQKISKTQKAASLYAGHYPKKINEKRGWRIDLLCLTINDENCEIKHYENLS